MFPKQKRKEQPLGVRIARWVLFGLALGICLFIFFNSAADAEESGGESLAVTEIVARVFVGDYPDLSPEEQTQILERMHAHVRTAAHFSEFAALGLFVMLFLLSFGTDFTPDPVHRWKCYLAGYAFCVLYAVSDEVHQLFVEGRVADVADVLTDSLGALAGCLVALAIGRLIGVLIGRSRRRRSA